MTKPVLEYWTTNLPNAKFVNQYGPTEATASCTYYVVDEDMFYHISGCPYTGEINYMFFSAEGCLLTGAKACEHCIEGRMDQ